MIATMGTSFKLAVVLSMALVLFSGLAPLRETYALESLSVDIKKEARLVEGGQSVELKGKVRCAVENFEVLEAFVYIVQDGNNSEFAPIPVSCTGRPNAEVFYVIVSGLDFVFHPGEATASVFILLVDPLTEETLSLSEVENIRIR